MTRRVGDLFAAGCLALIGAAVATLLLLRQVDRAVTLSRTVGPR